MEIKDLIYELTTRIQKSVKPHIGKISSRHSLGKAIGGDTTFVIDEIAEKETGDFLKKCGNIAYYSEDKGLNVFGKPEFVLIIDPIDGTRPAAAGLESCCVSVAGAVYKENPKMKDVLYGCIQEIKNETIFFAEKGKNVKIEAGNNEVPIIISNNDNMENLFWTIGFRGRPAEPLITVLGELVDISSVDGGVFDLGSACFSLTRLITGQMDAYVDVGKRMIEEVPEINKCFEKVGRGSVLNNNPYDVAAAALIVEESGCIITDAYGCSLNDYYLLGSGPAFQFSTVATASVLLHKKIIVEIDKGMQRLKNKFLKSL